MASSSPRGDSGVRVFLLSAYEGTDFGGAPDWLRRRSRPTLAEVVLTPAEADLVLFVESHPPVDPYFLAVRRNPVFRAHANKVVLYHDADRCVTAMRTLSPSLEGWQHDRRRKRSFHYIARLCENSTVDATLPSDRPRSHLFSFVGSTTTHPIRKRIMALRHPGGLLRDTGESMAWLMPEQERLEYEARYVEATLSSQFVLCPRGFSCSTHRLFETMRLARAPVIVSDEWVPVEGVPWNDVAIRVAEHQIERIPAILESRAAEAVSMGWRARAAWERFFSPEVTLDRLAEVGVDLLRHPYRSLDRVLDTLEMARPWHLVNFVRYWRRRFHSALAPGRTPDR